MFRRIGFGVVTLCSVLAGADDRDVAPIDTNDPAPHVEPASWFVDVTGHVGLELPARADRLRSADLALPEIMGSGLAVADFDGDADLDVLLVRDAQGRPRLFANRLLDGTGASLAFDDASARLPVISSDGIAMGVAVGDVDNDGDLDLFISGVGVAALWINESGRFRDRPESLDGLTLDWGASAAFCDVDIDGDLDLFVVNYVRSDDRACANAAGEDDYCPPNVFPALVDVLLINRGDGWFSTAEPLDPVPRAGLGTICFDVDRDQSIDIAVANDGDPNQLWVQARGGWREVAVARGFAVNLFGAEEAGMGVVLADLQNDGALDLFVTHIDDETNTLWVGSKGRFFDETPLVGLGPPSLGRTGFGVAAFDADADGDLDLAVANGKVRRPGGTPLRRSTYAEANSLFENRGGVFHERCRADAFCVQPDVARGLVARDIDADGDLDLLTSDNEGRLKLHRNEGAAKRWVAVRAWDADLGRDAIGALVELELDGRRLSQPVVHTTSYLSARDATAFFGLGDSYAATDVAVDVTWPDGARERFVVPRNATALVVKREGSCMNSVGSCR